MNVIHKITGYDKATEKLALEYNVPQDRLNEIRDIANVPAAQQETFGAFPLDSQSAWKVAWRLHLKMNVDYYDWFFEPFSDDAVAQSGGDPSGSKVQVYGGIRR